MRILCTYFFFIVFIHLNVHESSFKEIIVKATRESILDLVQEIGIVLCECERERERAIEGMGRVYISGANQLNCWELLLSPSLFVDLFIAVVDAAFVSSCWCWLLLLLLFDNDDDDSGCSVLCCSDSCT